MLARTLYCPMERCGTTSLQDINAHSFSCLMIRFLHDGHMRCLEYFKCLSVTTISVNGVLAHWFCPVQRGEMSPTLGQVIEVMEVGLDTH